MHATRTLALLAAGWASVAAAAPPVGMTPRAEAPAADAPRAELKVTRLAIFSSGVAYFECEATVTDSAVAELKFRTDQINDILKSLVVQDLGGGTIGSVGYASRDPIDKTLKSFAVDITGKPTLPQLFDQLRGEPVEITGPRQIKGVIVGVETQTIQLEKGTIEVHLLNVLTDAGLEQLRIDPGLGVHLTNGKIDAELRKALATLATGHDADKKTVSIEFNGQGQRRVRAAYLLEAPIWKTSYRLVLSEKDKPFLQGWATVENATEDDWRDVRLSLVSGRPISFTMDLYTPLYVPRPREELELYASLRPPEYEGGATFGYGGMAATKEDKEGDVVARAPRAGGRLAERGVVADRAYRQLGVAAVPPAEMAHAAIDLAGVGVASVASAKEAGELFEYTIQTPVSVARQRSAMLPIVNEPVDGEKISIYNPATHPKYPLNGLIMHNTTALNLMQGPLTVFDGNVYAGDAKLPDLKPNEKRMLAYALDLSTEVMVEAMPHPDEIVSLRIVKGTLWHKHKYVDERTYTLKNKDRKDRTLVIEQPTQSGWQLIEPKEPFERTETLLRFKLPVAAGKTEPFKVRTEYVADQSVQLSNAGYDVMSVFLRSRVISPAVKEAIEKLVAMRTELDNLGRTLSQREKEVKEAVDEQARVRENLKTLQQNTDPYQRQLTKFDTIETQIEKLRGQIGELREQVASQRKAIDDYLASLTVE